MFALALVIALIEIIVCGVVGFVIIFPLALLYFAFKRRRTRRLGAAR
ncbi:MAG TPA: hypothetical protein VJ770_23055 [Stellaceae bacterium]|nr:hypothetical protein [Stellaceae bacterium]